MEPKFSTPELRRLLKRHYLELGRQADIWQSLGNGWCHARLPEFPNACRGMLCGAKTRQGTPCKNDGTSYGNGRCKFHGGASTGPKTAQGKARSAKNGLGRAALCPQG